jgi:hypothetical protein
MKKDLENELAQRSNNDGFQDLSMSFEELKDPSQNLSSENTSENKGKIQKNKKRKKAVMLIVLCAALMLDSCTMPCMPRVPEETKKVEKQEPTPTPDPAPTPEPTPEPEPTPTPTPEPETVSEALSRLKSNIYEAQYQTYSTVDKTQVTQQTNASLYNQLAEALNILYSTQEGKAIIKKIPSKKVEIWVTDFNTDPTDAVGKFKNEPARFSYMVNSETYVVKLNSNSLKNKEWNPDLLPFLFGRYLLAAEHKEIALQNPLVSPSREEIDRITVQNAFLDASGKMLITELQDLEVEKTGKKLQTVITNGTYKSSLYGNFYTLKDLVVFRDDVNNLGKEGAQQTAFETYLDSPSVNFQLENPAAANMDDAVYSYPSTPSVNFSRSVGFLNNRVSDCQAYSSKVPYLINPEANKRLNAADEVIALNSISSYNVTTNTIIINAQKGGNSY